MLRITQLNLLNKSEQVYKSPCSGKSSMPMILSMGFFMREFPMRRETGSRRPDQGRDSHKAWGNISFLAWCGVSILLAITLCISTYAQSNATKPASSDLPPGNGKAAVQRACTTCHTAGTISRKRATAAEWSATVDEMVNRGAELSDEEIVTVSRYLAASFPATSNPGMMSTPAIP
jgi:mono/diheme cytochrome c family protein